MSCIVHALENDQIKGYEYTLRGNTGITFDGILETLAKHCGVSNYIKSQRSYIIGLFENFAIGRTHDKNMVRLFYYLVDENDRMARNGATELQEWLELLREV